jgi:hypothetical protein
MAKRDLRFLTLITIGCLVLAGCSSSLYAQSPSAIPVDDGFQLTVPALWADAATSMSGIEPAGIWAGTVGPPGFDIDLASIEAEGAGRAWTAASASAAAVASMYSGIDPSAIDIHFTITGPIDGPSAGGILTVGALAALRGVSLLPGVTMTGTISPDGSIGRVGGITLKLEAAKEAGFSTVLLPPSNMQILDQETGEVLDAREVGALLGLTVRPVVDVAVAYREFTGLDLVPLTTASFTLPPSVLAAGSETASRLITLLETRVLSLKGAAAEAVSLELAEASRALASGDSALAYGLGVDALYRSSRIAAEQETETAIDVRGIPATVATLRAKAKRAEERARSALLRGSAVEPIVYEQQMVTPSALTWLAYSIASLQALQPRLTETMSEPEVLAAGRTIALMSASIDVLGPDAQEVVQAMPGKPALPASRVATFLSGYTNFLVRAGRANRAYLQDVLLRGQSAGDAEQAAALDSELTVLARLDALTQEIPAGENALAEEISQAATALTYYVTSGEIVSSIQSFDAADLGIGQESPTVGNTAALNASVASAQGLVTDLADHLAGQGLDAGYPTWSGQWGVAAFEALDDTERSTAGAGLALDELWYAAIAELMVNAGWVRM